MDWKLCAHISVFLILMISLECSCNWSIKLNKMKDKKGQIVWEDYRTKRQKREWIAPPMSIREEEDNRYRNPLAKVHSDIEVKKGTITYRATGQGLDQPPYNLFIMDPKTGYLNVTGVIIDREVISWLRLTVHAVTITGQEVERPLDLRVRVLDINDNPPIFSQSIFVGAIEERSKANTMVMQIIAQDADEENTVNSQIAYKILSQSPSDPQMFIMNQHTGQVFTMSSYLDRESISSYSLIVSGSDLNGAAGGLGGQCGADINILDVNDNFPELEFDSYSVEIMENMIGLTNLRMKVYDADLMYSDNWLAVFEIVSGNEGGWFAIDTDAQTNEGVLRIVKALDYEAMKSANLAILVSNRAAYHYSVLSEYKAKVTGINVQVQNEIEGPAFVPSNFNIKIPAGLSQADLLQFILARVTAIDVETGGPATNVVYMMGTDASKWLIIDSTTGEIKMTYEMARNASNAPKNLTATIFAIDGTDPARNATATANIDTTGLQAANCPVITQEPRVACDKNVILVGSPATNAPLTLTTDPGNGWNLIRLNDTAFTLVGDSSIGFNNYTVRIFVTDKNGVTCSSPFSVVIQACQCTASGFCDASKQASKSVSLGPAAIGLMILGFLALLLALLLLPLCLCGAAAAGSKFVPVASGYEGACQQWGTEGGKPEDVDMRSMLINSGGPDYSEVHTSNIVGLGARAGSIGIAEKQSNNAFETNTNNGEMTGYVDSRRGYLVDSNLAGSLPPPYRENATLNMAYVENYFAEKADTYANEDESRPSNDCLLIYDNEGIGSPAGSIGCCSFIADDLDDVYLDTLGPKFKTLAEICIGAEIDPIPNGDGPKLFPNVPIIETDTTMFDEPIVNVSGARSVPITSSTHVTSSSYSSSNLPPARPIPETFIPGNVVVTETYTTSGGTMRPAARIVDPGIPTNILVTERVVGSGSGVFSDIPDGSNVIVTERVVRPANMSNMTNMANMSNMTNMANMSTMTNMANMSNMTNMANMGNMSNMTNMANMANISDGSNVVLRERIVAPRDSRLSNTFNIGEIGDAQNVVVTERLIQPISNVQGNLTIRPEMGSSQNIYVTEKTVRSGPPVTTHMLSAEPIFTQGSTSPNLTRSSVTKYSTVQYTKK